MKYSFVSDKPNNFRESFYGAAGIGIGYW